MKKEILKNLHVSHVVVHSYMINAQFDFSDVVVHSYMINVQFDFMR